MGHKFPKFKRVTGICDQIRFNTTSLRFDQSTKEFRTCGFLAAESKLSDKYQVPVD